MESSWHIMCRLCQKYKQNIEKRIDRRKQYLLIQRIDSKDKSEARAKRKKIESSQSGDGLKR